MKVLVKCIIVMLILVSAYFSMASASNTTTIFQTGPFNVSVDIGKSCGDINIIEPTPYETLSGFTGTKYPVKICNDVTFEFAKYDQLITDSLSKSDLVMPANPAARGDNTASLVKSSLLSYGADANTVLVYSRQIDGKPGAVGSGSILGKGITVYLAEFYVSADSTGFIAINNNESEMISAMKTIHVTEKPEIASLADFKATYDSLEYNPRHQM
jgi:hypothetical protein